jgi:hypothetical protein
MDTRHRSGKDDEARATFTRAVTAMKPTPDSAVVVDARNLPCYLAWAYAGLAEKEKANPTNLIRTRFSNYSSCEMPAMRGE